MGKQNTKAGATQLRQDQAAAAAAEAATIAGTEEQQLQENAAPLQDAAGATDNSSTEEQLGSEGEANSQEQASAEGEAGADQAAPEVKDIVIEPIAPTPPAAVVVEKAVVVEAAVPVSANASTNEQLAVILKDVPAAHQIDINRIQAYLERMAPKRPIDSKVGVAEQVAMYRAIQNIINRQEEFFTQLFTALLFIFKAEGKSGAMSDRYRMRFMDNITLHQGDRKAFANLTQMLHILADVKSRELALGQVNLEKALENGLTAEGRKRVLDYFGA